MARFLLSILTGYIFSLLFPGGIPMPPVKQIATGKEYFASGVKVLHGPWPEIRTIWPWAMVAYKLGIAMMIFVVIRLTLWARQLAKK